MKAQNKRLIDSLKYEVSIGPDDTLKAKNLNDLVWYIKFSDPDTSLLLLDESEALSKKLDFADGLGNSYNNRAIIYTVQGNYDEAVRYYKLAIPEFQRNNDGKGVGFCNANMAVCFEYQGLLDSALFYNEKALEIRKQAGHEKGISQSYNNIGVIYYNQGYYNMALEKYLDALYFYENKPEKTEIDRSYLGSFQNNVGNIYNELKQPKKAKQYLEGARETYRGIADKREWAYLLGDLGNAYQLLGETNKALVAYHRALSFSVQSDDKAIETANYLNLSSLFLETGKLDSARIYSSKGIKIGEGMSDKNYLISLYHNLGKIHLEQRVYSLAISNFDKSLKLASNAGIFKQNPEIYAGMAQAYAGLGKHKKANEYLENQIMATDSVLTSEKHRQLAEMEALYQNEKKTRQLEHQEAEMQLLECDNQNKAESLRAKNRLILSICIGLLLIIGALILLWLEYQRKQSAYQILVKKNLELVNAAKPRDTSGLKNGELFALLQQRMKAEKLYRNPDISQESLASELATNRTYLSQAVSDHAKKDFRAYINEYRINDAMELLSDTETAQKWTIMGIASEVGFKSISAFNKAFKQFSGVTPSYFRDHVKK